MKEMQYYTTLFLKKTSSKIKKKVELDNHTVVFMRSLAAGKRYKCTSVCLLVERSAFAGSKKFKNKNFL